MKTLITNGQIITATDNYKADIFIDGETITTIGAKLDMDADVTIDASGNALRIHDCSAGENPRLGR